MATPVILWKDDGTGRVALTPRGLALVESMARADKTLRSIAAKLKMPFRKLDKMLDRNKGDNPERMAWELGHADHEQHVRDVVRAKALGDCVELPIVDERGEPILDEETGEFKMARVQIPSSGKDGAVLLIWYTKQLGWSEKPTGVINNDNRIQLTLAEPTSAEDMFKRLGIEGLLDFRKDKSKELPKTLPWKVVNPTQALGKPLPASGIAPVGAAPLADTPNQESLIVDPPENKE